LAKQVFQREGRFPDLVVITHAGGGNVTGTARGLKIAGSDQTTVVGASVDLRGLHMASDIDFNRKSFTTGHSGFGIPFLTWPDRTDVPRNCARGLRYLDRYVLVTQGDVFYTTELLAKLEGMERGPAGNTSLTAAIPLAMELERDRILVVQETEYTAAGKLPSSQLTFAKENGIEVRRGNPRDNIPGKVIVIPERIEQIQIEEMDLGKIRQSYIRNVLEMTKVKSPIEDDILFIAEDSKSSVGFVRKLVDSAHGERQILFNFFVERNVSFILDLKAFRKEGKKMKTRDWRLSRKDLLEMDIDSFEDLKPVEKENLKLVMTELKGWAHQSVDEVLSVMAEDSVYYDITFQPAIGHKGIREFGDGWVNAVPDFRPYIEAFVVKGTRWSIWAGSVV
jgi:hypothetical protein